MIVACFVRLVVNSVHLNKKKRGAVIVDAAIAKVLRIELFLHSERSFDLGYFLNYFQAGETCIESILSLDSTLSNTNYSKINLLHTNNEKS